MNWKDAFYFTKTERNGIVVLLVLIALVIVSPFLLNIFRPSKTYDFSEFDKKVREFEQLHKEYVSARAALENKTGAYAGSGVSVRLNPFIFDPNELTQSEWSQMGLPENIIRNIINYRNAGGRFRYREDLKRIYSIDDPIYEQLETYIDLPSRTPGPAASTVLATAGKNVTRSDETRYQPERESLVNTPLIIDINLADTLQWQQIRGIGPVFARRIVSYRELLGGFHSESQLLEVFGMDSARFVQIEPYIMIDDKNLHQIDINTADFVTLVRHPYLNRNQVNSIIRMRELHGPFTSVGEIKRSELINDSVFNKIAPYFSTGFLP
jgi:competence protein ComEA